MALGACHGGRPSFPPPPVLGRSKLGAVDMPIGCALTFHLLLAQIRSPENAQYKFREALWRFTANSDESRNYSVAWRSLGLRSRCRAFRPKKSA
jgi:hypothetical protein